MYYPGPKMEDTGGLVEGKRFNRRWARFSALKFKELLWWPRSQTSGLGNRFHDPTPAYSNSLRPTPAQVSLNQNFGWNELE